jgi:hypothetical protein
MSQRKFLLTVNFRIEEEKNEDEFESQNEKETS